MKVFHLNNKNPFVMSSAAVMIFYSATSLLHDSVDFLSLIRLATVVYFVLLQREINQKSWLLTSPLQNMSNLSLWKTELFACIYLFFFYLSQNNLTMGARLTSNVYTFVFMWCRKMIENNTNIKWVKNQSTVWSFA